MRMQREQACLCVIDIQERLFPVMTGGDEVEANTALLLKAAARLDVPVLASEQYPKGLGPTVSGLAGLLNNADIQDKTAFSCHGDDAWRRRFAGLARRQAILCGIETHICVLQTALDLKESGVDVFVVADAVASRTETSKAHALARLRDNGIEVVTTEMVLFEWLDKAGTPTFKELSGWIK